uniref:ATP-dependent RNA helicase SUV3 DEXQ-box helicase domain-containing protein n=1 Tax=Zea mays TaxID=4577 RepID=A0A804RK11_MAIZE
MRGMGTMGRLAKEGKWAADRREVQTRLWQWAGEGKAGPKREEKVASALPGASPLAPIPADDAHDLLLPAFAEFCCASNLADELRQPRSLMAADDLTPRDLMATADLTAPHTWYPSARAMRRRVVYHCGPTNSGKTHNALASFSAAKSGVYCSPLRLLTIEIFDKVNTTGVSCSLRTGQEVKEVAFASHLACTIEMHVVDRRDLRGRRG